MTDHADRRYWSQADVDELAVDDDGRPLDEVERLVVLGRSDEQQPRKLLYRIGQQMLHLRQQTEPAEEAKLWLFERERGWKLINETAAQIYGDLHLPAAEEPDVLRRWLLAELARVRKDGDQ